MTFARISAGKRGEDLAVSYLKRHGFEIVEKNYKTKHGEIDIIGNDKDCISFVEVRSKNTDKFGLPEYTINRKKQTQLTKMALSYIKRYSLEDRVCRFDVICVEDVNSHSPKIRHIRNAFELDCRYR
ncbi:MAG: YraN family protein [Candidatus Omnitrophica bacterium]|nr:YraN family protein [Candidatus Omnitrophota bacterium]